MKKILGLIFILSLTLHSNAQHLLTTKDSINLFYDSLFSSLKTDYLHKNDVNWNTVEQEIRSSLNQFSNFKNSLSQTTVLFDKIKATHCQLYYKDTVYTATYNGPTEKDFSEQWIKKYVSNPGFEVQVLDNQYGYILMPSINFEDISAENVRKVAQPMYDQIYEIKSKYKLNGWIIDLRFNSGGHIYPMLLALYDFLGNNTVWGELNYKKEPISNYALNNGNYLQDKKVIYAIDSKGNILDNSKIAIITNIGTASSGEITAIAFKGRNNTIFIGEQSNGMTTSNEKRDFPFGIYMAFTMGYDCDRNGNFYDKIIPEITVSKQDNFDNLLLDKNIEEAIKWFNKK